jgi:hypothetical protein
LCENAFHARLPSGYIWPGKRAFIKTAGGRKRYNVLGALNFAAKAMSATGGDAYINASSAVELLNKLLPEYPGSILNIAPGNAKC